MPLVLPYDAAFQILKRKTCPSITFTKQTNMLHYLINGSLFDRWAKIDTSRKTMFKLPKHRRAASKATSREAAGDDPDLEQSKRSTAKTLAITKRRTDTAGSALPGTQFVFLLSLAVRPKIICRTVHLHISELTPGPYGTQSQAPLTHRAVSLHLRNVPRVPPEQVLLKICRLLVEFTI